MAKSKTKSQEEVLQRKREAERARREHIRHDPELKKIQREKQRKWNEKKYQTGKLKLVANMTEREHSKAKKEWRERARQYYDRKKNQKPAKGRDKSDSCSGLNSTPQEKRHIQRTFLQELGEKKRKRNRMNLLRAYQKLQKKKF